MNFHTVTDKAMLQTLLNISGRIAQQDKEAHYGASSSPLIEQAADQLVLITQPDPEAYHFLQRVRESLEKQITRRYGVRYATGLAAMDQDIDALYRKRGVSRPLCIASGILDLAIGRAAQARGITKSHDIGNGLVVTYIANTEFAG